MSMDLLQAFLGWNALVHFAILMLWFAAFAFAHDLCYRLHSTWFKLTPETFDAIHYGIMAGYKMSIFVFFLMPYLVLRFLL